MHAPLHPVFDRPSPALHFRLSTRGFPPIAAMRQPGPETDWNELADLGFRYVIRLAGESPSYKPSPLTALGEIPLEDQYELATPTPAEIEIQKIRHAIQLLADGLETGGVVIHCVGGRGRTGTVIGAFLCSHGHDPASVRAMLDTAYQSAHRPGWPENEWQGEVLGEF